MSSFSHSPGIPLPLGATILPKGINFSLFSRNAETVSLVLFLPGHAEVLKEIPLDPELNRTGDIWHILVHDLDPRLRYGYRVGGPFDPGGSGHFFRSDRILLDPYARALSGGTEWGKFSRRKGRAADGEASFHRRCCVVDEEFDWEGDRPLNIAMQDSIIYEMHVRGFTRHPSSGVSHPGTYHGVVEKIPYLLELGVTAVELMPVQEFNENENTMVNPLSGERLKNFWGYSPLAFFAPKAAYAVAGKDGQQVREFKEMVKALHRAGIEVILDVVFNHTAEGGSDGPVVSYRGLDNTIYYLLDPQHHDYLNFSGCGNTMNCNHPLVRNLIMDCLHYWVTEMHVDGFRFDLASILGRDRQGHVLSNPPIVEQIGEDPILARTKIIAEAWDASGLYQVGSFSSNPRWAEWNGRFRDDVRRFICGAENVVAPLATRIAGSSDLYQSSLRRPYNSINFVTSHDGFTLHDLVSYNQKHNLANGENNRDGSDYNASWNSGVEGETLDRKILALRQRRMRTLMVLLFLSQGVPMLVAGEEFGRSQQGNNNAYCQDNEISWLDWSLVQKNKGLHRFFRLLIRLRKQHRVFRRADFFTGGSETRPEEIRWQSVRAGEQDWSPACRTLAFFLDGRQVNGGDNDFFVMFNGNRRPRSFELPALRENQRWHKIIDTGAASPADIVEEELAEVVEKQKIMVCGMGAVVLFGKS